jgi:hypothetical protein
MLNDEMQAPGKQKWFWKAKKRRAENAKEKRVGHHES